MSGSNCQANDGPDWDCRALPLNHSITMTDFLLSGLVAYSSYYLHKTQTGGSMAPDVTPRWLAPLPCDMQQAVIQVITRQSICSGVLPLLLPTHPMTSFNCFCTQEKERTMISGIKPRTTEPLAQLELTEWPSRANGTITLTFYYLFACSEYGIQILLLRQCPPETRARLELK